MLLFMLQLAMMRVAPASLPDGTGPPETNSPQDEETEVSRKPRSNGLRMGPNRGLLRQHPICC